MAERIDQVTETTTNNPELGRSQTTTTAVRDEKVRGSSLAARIVGFLLSILLVLLGVRFVLLLLGANTATGFVDFILDITGPLVTPFNGIFGNPADSVRFEPQTLTAIVVYGLIGLAIMYAVRIRQPKV